MIFNPVYGGNASANLGSKTITANGTYLAASDNLDGYDEVIASVPNTYVASDEGKVVSNGTLVAQTSTNISANGTYDITANNSAVVNVPNSYSASDEGKVVQSQVDYIRTNNVALNITLSNWLYRASDKFEFEYKNIGSHTNNWGVFIATVANTNPLWIQYNLWGGRSCMNVRHNGTWSGDGAYSFDGPSNTTKYYKVTLDGSAFTIMSGSAKGTYGTTEVSQNIGSTSDTDTVNPVLFATNSGNALNIEFYGLRVYRGGTLIHNYQPYDGGVYDAVDGTTYLATASGGTYGGSTYALVAQTSRSISANDTYDTTLNDEVVVNVPNSYSASDEGKVVSGGALVSQGSATYTTDGTYNTTLIDNVIVSVGGGGVATGRLLVSTLKTEIATEDLAEDHVSGSSTWGDLTLNNSLNNSQEGAVQLATNDIITFTNGTFGNYDPFTVYCLCKRTGSESGNKTLVGVQYAASSNNLPNFFTNRNTLYTSVWGSDASISGVSSRDWNVLAMSAENINGTHIITYCVNSSYKRYLAQGNWGNVFSFGAANSSGLNALAMDIKYIAIVKHREDTKTMQENIANIMDYYSLT